MCKTTMVSRQSSNSNGSSSSRGGQNQFMVYALASTAISVISILYAFRNISCVQEVVISQQPIQMDHATTTTTTTIQTQTKQLPQLPKAKFDTNKKIDPPLAAAFLPSISTPAIGTSSALSRFVESTFSQPPWFRKQVLTPPQFFLMEDSQIILRDYGSLHYPLAKKKSSELSKRFSQYLCAANNLTYVPPAPPKNKVNDAGNGANPESKVDNAYYDSDEATNSTSAGTISDATKCTMEVNIIKCINCPTETGEWYVGSSYKLGIVLGRMKLADPKRPSSMQVDFFPPKIEKNTTTVNTLTVEDIMKDEPFPIKQIDVCVPIKGQDEKMLNFTSTLNSAVTSFNEIYPDIKVRLLVSRYPGESTTPFYTAMANRAHNTTVTFVNVTKKGSNGNDDDAAASQPFSRARAVNTLHNHTCHDKSCIVAVLDVDLEVSATFFMRAMTFVSPRKSAYFPIMFSNFNPEVVSLVELFKAPTPLYRYDTNRGLWREFSYGMYAISGYDAARFFLNEEFVGWGGEDNDFYARIASKLNIIRSKDHGLIHLWHPKECEIGEFVQKKYFQSCITSAAAAEGSPLGLYLRDLQQNNPQRFSQVIGRRKALQLAANNETFAPVKIKLARISKKDKVKQHMEEAAVLANNTVLVGVVSSRQQWGTRVKAIAETWGHTLPNEVTLRYFVGANEENPSISGKSDDISALAQEAGLIDRSQIVVMTDVTDNEYPPVRKNSAMIRKLDEITDEKYHDWIYKVDDDSYVNIGGLVNFVSNRNKATPYQVWGEPGHGRPRDRAGLASGGLKAPYCTGGPGYIMNRDTLKLSAQGMKSCVQQADESPYREFLWHSDVVIGICVYNMTGAGCQSGGDMCSNRPFAHNFGTNGDAFVATRSLATTVAMHPFKNVGMMHEQHKRYETAFPQSFLTATKRAQCFRASNALSRQYNLTMFS